MEVWGQVLKKNIFTEENKSHLPAAYFDERKVQDNTVIFIMLIRNLVRFSVLHK